MEKPKNRPLATPKPLDQSLPKLEFVIILWTLHSGLNFIALPSGVSSSHIRDFAHQVFKACLGSCNSLKPTPRR